jgi:hypothetical protein
MGWRARYDRDVEMMAEAWHRPPPPGRQFVAGGTSRRVILENVDRDHDPALDALQEYPMDTTNDISRCAVADNLQSTQVEHQSNGVRAAVRCCGSPTLYGPCRQRLASGFIAAASVGEWRTHSAF